MKPFRFLFPAAALLAIACQNDNSVKVESNPKPVPSLAGLDPGSFYPSLPDTLPPAVDSTGLTALEASQTRPLGKASAAMEVKLCTAINYGGNCMTIDASLKIDYNDLRIINPLGNDAVSSGYTTGGAVIYLCDAVNWGGPCYPMSGNVPDFRQFPFNGSPFNFNDKTTSFKFDVATNGNYVEVYDAKFGGDGSETPCKLLGPFDYNMMPCGYNDRVSSQYPRLDYPNPPRPWAGWFYKGGSFTLEGYDSDWNSPVLDPAHFDNTFSSFKWDQP